MVCWPIASPSRGPWVAMPVSHRRFRPYRAWPQLVRGRVALIVAAVQLTTLAACGETTVNEPLSAGTLATVSGNGQVGVAGQTLPAPIQVRVLGSDDQPLPGATVTFAVTTGGGTVSPASATSDANGLASTTWTLGKTAGNNVLTVTAGTATMTVAASGTAARASTVSGTSGDNQTTVVNTAVTLPPTVRVNDANGNPVEGVAVTFAVASGGGRVTDGLRRTNAQGVATVGSWVLGPTAGTQTLTARVEESGVANNPVLFTGTATAGAASQLVALTATSQAATVGTAVATLPSVRVTDAAGNPVAGTQVTFAIVSGNGQVTPTAVASNAQGIATVTSWTLGPVAGVQQLSATIAGAPAVLFSATATAGAAAQLSIAAGNNQRAQTTRAVTIAPSVIVRDALGNRVAGAVVTFTVASGGGSVVGGRQVTDATGTAEVGGWFLGDVPGTNTLTASTPNVAAVTFTAIGDPGRAVSMVANSATAQSAAAGADVADPPSVVVRDLAGNPVAGVAVTFAVTAGGGAVVGSPVTTNASGVATVTSWTLGSTVGANTVVASATGLPSVTFTATATAGAAASVVATAGTNQVALQGTAVTTRPTVRVTDALGNVVSGATVTFAVTAGGGTLTGVTQVTDAAGIATVGSWTLGNLSPNTMTATVTGAGITGNPVTFTAQGVTTIALTSVPTGPITLGTDFTITAQLRDAAGAAAPLAGVTLTIAIDTGGGTLNGTLTATTDAAGAATFTVNVTGAVGARTIIVTGTGLTSATTAAITFN
jgi:adhesin/invasin